MLITGLTPDIRQVNSTNLAASLLKTTPANLPKHPDYFQLVPEPSITLEQVRQVTKLISQKPYQADYIVFSLEEAHLATFEAQNALLKILEEPPSYAQIIISAPNSDLLLPTLVSRCQEIPLLSKNDSQAKPAAIETNQLLDKLLSGGALDCYALLPTTKQALWLDFDKITVLAAQKLTWANQPQRSCILALLKSINQAKNQLDKNANLHLVIANFLLSTPNRNVTFLQSRNVTP